MFGTQWLDVAIGMIFVYLLTSVLASAVLEVLETGLRARAKYLWQGLGELLGDPSARAGGAKCEAAQKSAAISLRDLYEHPVVFGLYFGNYDQAKRRLAARKLPSYIPRESFSTAVIDLVSKRCEAKGVSAVETLRRGVEGLPPSQLEGALRAILRVAGDDIGAVKQRLEAWYDTSMDRVAGWYKRHAQLTLLIVGFALAVAGNIDSWQIAKDLVENQPKREAIVQSADAFAASHTKETLALTGEDMKKYLATLDDLKTPLSKRNDNLLDPVSVLVSLLGYLVTAFAVSLGAPFWFDLLNKFMVVRSTVKPKEKSGDEGSEDRRTAQGPSPVSFLK